LKGKKTTFKQVGDQGLHQKVHGEAMWTKISGHIMSASGWGVALEGGHGEEWDLQGCWLSGMVKYSGVHRVKGSVGGEMGQGRGNVLKLRVSRSGGKLQPP